MTKTTGTLTHIFAMSFKKMSSKTYTCALLWIDSTVTFICFYPIPFLSNLFYALCVVAYVRRYWTWTQAWRPSTMMTMTMVVMVVVVMLVVVRVVSH